MATICPACGTENRSVAKFCIECIAPLPNDFAATQVLTVPARAQARVEREMPSVLAAFASASGPPSSPSPASSPAPAALGAPAALANAAAIPPPVIAQRVGFGVGIGVGVALFALLLAGTIGWLAAGGDVSRHRDERADAAGTQTTQRAAAGVLASAQAEPAAAAPTAPVAGPTASESLAPGEAVVQAAPPAPVLAAAVPERLAEPPPPVVPAPAPAAPVAAAAPSTTHPAAPVAIRKSAPPVPAVPRPERASSFMARCEGLGFIAESRCKVELCQQPGNRQRKECEPVFAQQRLVEEKRNPVAN